MSRIVRSFREMLGRLSRGDVDRHLNDELTKAIDALEACPADKCKAEITLKVTLEFELGRIDIKTDIKSKLPETVKFMKTPFWAIEGQLSLEHPSQVDMFATHQGGRSTEDERESRDAETA